MRRSLLALVVGLILAMALPVEPAPAADGRCDWLGDPELIARCEAGGGSPGRGHLPQEWLDYGKGWKVAKTTTCPDGSPRVLRQLYWLDGELFGTSVTAFDFGWHFGQGDVVPYSPARSDGSPAIFAADNLVPDVAYCVHPLDGIDLYKEIRRRAPAGTTGKSPIAEGLTGLDTWLWYEGGTQIPPFILTFTDPGSGVTMQIEAWAGLGSFTWDMGDGSVVTSHTPGSSENLPESAATVYRYEQKGDYTITFGAGWNGTYRWRQLPGRAWSTPNPFAGNPATISTSFVYPVAEIRAVLTP